MAKRYAGMLFLMLAILTQVPLSANRIIYSAVPDPLPPNLPSLGYEATQTAEFGGLVGVDRPFALADATVAMSDWALASDYPGLSPSGWSLPITLNLYNIDSSSGTPQPGSVIASVTQTVSIPWRPPADPTCPGQTAWRAGDGNCYNGLAFPIAFDLGGVTVPTEFIYGVAFNTQNWGYNPTGLPGPYNSLNFALTTAPPTAGTNPLPGTAYWNTRNAGDYADGGAGGTGTFRQDSKWSPYSGSIEFSADMPEPGSAGLALAGGLMLLLGSIRFRAAARRASR